MHLHPSRSKNQAPHAPTHHPRAPPLNRALKDTWAHMHQTLHPHHLHRQPCKSANQMQYKKTPYKWPDYSNRKVSFPTDFRNLAMSLQMCKKVRYKCVAKIGFHT